MAVQGVGIVYSAGKVSKGNLCTGCMCCLETFPTKKSFLVTFNSFMTGIAFYRGSRAGTSIVFVCKFVVSKFVVHISVSSHLIHNSSA